MDSAFNQRQQNILQRNVNPYELSKRANGLGYWASNTHIRSI